VLGSLLLSAEQGCKPGAFGMHPEHRAQAGQPAQAPEQRGIIDSREFIQAAGRHERLEGHHAVLVKLVEILEVTADIAAPVAVVDHRMRRHGVPFDAQRGAIERRRVVVQGHVQHCSDATGSRRAGAGGIALPMRAARFVQMDVAVHQTRQQVQPAGLQRVCRLDSGVGRQDGGDLARHNGYVGGHHGVLCDYGRAANREISLHARIAP